MGVTVVLVVSMALGWAMSVGRTRPLTVFGVLAGGQALLHTVLSFTSVHEHGIAGSALPAWAMVAGHALAALIATALIVHTDRIAAAWFRFLSVLLGVEPPLTPAFAERRVRRVSTPMQPAPSSDFVAGLLRRRGPPAGVPALCLH